MNIKLAIFDLDGTAADTMDGIREALNRSMEEAGYPTHTRESILGFINYGTRQFIENALPAEARTEEEILRLMALYNKHYDDTYTMTTPYPGVPALLARLGEHCLVAMNSNKQDAFVKALGERLFPADTFCAAEGFRVDRPAKPDPGMALAIMAEASRILGEELTPADCVYIGDSDIDFYTARNAGMHLVSVSWGYRSYDFLRALGDQPVARDCDELWEILMNSEFGMRNSE